VNTVYELKRAKAFISSFLAMISWSTTPKAFFKESIQFSVVFRARAISRLLLGYNHS
jgi:hypothetical protein